MDNYEFNSDNFLSNRNNLSFNNFDNNNSMGAYQGSVRGNNTYTGPLYLTKEYASVPTPGYDPADETLKLSQANYMDKASSFYDAKLADMNSWQHQYLQPATQVIGALGTLSGMYLGFKQLGMAKEQLGMAKEQWRRAKAEADRIAKVREGIVKAYTS